MQPAELHKNINKWSKSQKLKAVFVLLLMVIFVNTVLVYNTQILIPLQQWKIHTHEVIIKLENTFYDGDLAQACRNYTIVKNNYPKSYFIRETINTNIATLKQVTADILPQQQWFFLLEQRIKDKLENLSAELTINYGKALVSEQKLAILFTVNTQIVNDIQKLVQTIVQTEQNLLQNNIYQFQTTVIESILGRSYFSIAGFVVVLLYFGSIIGLIYLLQVCTIKLKQTQLQLLQSENRLQAIIDAQPDCIKLIATDGTLLEINAVGVAMMEVESASELIGTVFAGVLPEYKQAYNALHESVCQGNKGTLKFEMVGSKGTRRWMETYAVPLPNPEDNSFLHLAITRDITQRIHDEAKIRSQAMLLDVATNAILVKDVSQNKIQFWNQGAESIYGWQSQAAVGLNPEQLYLEDLPQSQLALQTTISQGEWFGELHQTTIDGRKIIVESRWILVTDDGGEPKSILIVNTDITQYKQLETQLLRIQRLESLGTLAGGIVHDLNNILAPILMSVQLLERKCLDPQHQRLLKTLEDNAIRGASLIKQILSFARGIEGKRATVQLKHVIAEIEQVVRETFPKSINLDVDIWENLGYVYGDATQIHQVLMNLVVNARDAMADGGTLRISAQNVEIDRDYPGTNVNVQPGVYVAIAITDTGLGMSTETQQQIFEPFFTTKPDGGTGLGLATAFGIIKNHGGFIDVASQIGKGSKFNVYFPLPAGATVAPKDDELEPSIGNGEVILVVDDEAAIREITKSCLEAFNYQVLTAGDGVEAQALYRKHQQSISIVVLDMIMPLMDGEITISRLQKINPDVKIIALSGLISDDKVVDGSSIGVRAFLPKPCSAKQLLQTIAKVNLDIS